MMEMCYLRRIILFLTILHCLQGIYPFHCCEYSELTKFNQSEDLDSITDAVEGAWPWMVNLEDRYKIHKCGATLLNKNWILTAAHCDIKPDWKIYIGRTNRSDKGGMFLETSMAKTITHDKYNSKTFQYNLRVVKLANPVVYKREKPLAAPVRLYNATEFPEMKYEDLFKPELRGVVTGWGKENQRSFGSSETLKQKQIRIVNDTTCAATAAKDNRQYDKKVTFCALGKGQDDKVIDTCIGDGGGPFVVNVETLDLRKKRKSLFIQIGIVSWGFGCGLPDTPGYYVRLTQELIDWINKAISDMPLKTTELPNSTTEEAPVGNTGISYSPAITSSVVPVTDMPLKTTELPNSTTEEAPVGKIGISYSPAITSSVVPVTDQSFPIKEEYFVGGGAVAGFVLVTLTSLYLCKWCRRRRESGAGVDEY